jgi:hypothetical protein
MDDDVLLQVRPFGEALVTVFARKGTFARVDEKV